MVAYGEVGDFVSESLYFVVVQSLDYGGIHVCWEGREEGSICLFEDAVLRRDELAG